MMLQPNLGANWGVYPQQPNLRATVEVPSESNTLTLNHVRAGNTLNQGVTKNLGRLQQQAMQAMPEGGAKNAPE